MKPIDHYRLAVFLGQKARLEKQLSIVSKNIELVQYSHRPRKPLGQRILDWWFA